MTVQHKTLKKQRISTTKRNLKFLSWNIQAPSTLEGHKFDIRCFQNTINKHDFLCLQEIREEVHLAGYRSFCNTRQGNKKAGGVGILIRNELIDGVDIIKNSDNLDYLVCKLKKSFFRFDYDIYLINVYARPHNTSSASNNLNGKETLKKVEEVTNDLQGKGKIILCGDFNARIAENSGMINHDTDEFIYLPDDYTPDDFSPRCSQDKTSNAYGTLFLNLILNNQLTILNGRTLGDFTGQFTSIQKQGCSVIDYFAISKELTSTVNHMKVCDFTEYSDHKPLDLEIQCVNIDIETRKPLEECYDPAPKRYIFNEHNVNDFAEAQSSQHSLDILRTLTDNLTNLTHPIDRPNSNNNTYSDTNSQLSTEIREVNDMFTKHLQGLANDCFKQTKAKKKRQSNNPWFNWQARLAKRELGKATRATSKFPHSSFLRDNYYKVKKSYKTLLSSIKRDFYTQLNSDIENGKILNWQSFKRLKQNKQKKLSFDSYDMDKFETFFTDLYSDKHKTVNTSQKECYMHMADELNTTTTDHPDSLNNDISPNEVKSAIKSLKAGKASSLDMISNEILKCLDCNHLTFLTTIFNACLTSGIYPWNVSVITPLHKKGNKSDPDNYRAVAVSSVIGKLFSTILLNRLIQFRKTTSPDPPNQLGFTKKAQTYDHILTMQTIASKYKKLHKPVYAIFVDFKKAFDSVCRQALFYKLAKNGITGKFYNVLRNMYANSYAYIKLSGHLSNKFNILKGTEQGHPLSPDLFKIFLSDLSPLLEYTDCPYLSNIRISHLLWADDLIMLSLNKKTAQLQLNKLSNFCKEWGIEINELKTKVVIFGEKFDAVSSNSNNSFMLNKKSIEIVDTYCYLGIDLHWSGQLRSAQKNLKVKAMRAFYGLKRVVMRSKLSFKALTTLFDSLIKPIVMYGAPLWMPSSPITKSLFTASNPNSYNVKSIISKINRTLPEKIHLPFLKWALGVHRKSSNIGVWGESGRFPIIYQCIRLSLNYYTRLNKLEDNSFIRAALHEQKLLNLSWYKNIESLLKLDSIYFEDHVTAHRILNHKSCARVTHSHPLPRSLKDLKCDVPLPSRQYRVNQISDVLLNHFKACWEHEKSISPKLSYYHSIKKRFARESYLDLAQKFPHRYSTTKLRISSHDLEIEKGRYQNVSRDQRICSWCNTCSGQQIMEDEKHLLFHCDLYAKLRSSVINSINNSPAITDTPAINITHSLLDANFMSLLSPNTVHELNSSTTNQYNQHHTNLNFKPKSPAHISLIETRSHIINRVCCFINRCFDERWKFLKDVKKTRKNKSDTRNPKTIIITITQ
jgi:exonuclease III